MSLLSTIGGLLPTAYQGFQRGVDDETQRQQRTADAAYQKEQRDRSRAMAPLEDEARTSRLKASIDADKAAGIEAGIKRTLLEDQQRNLPQQLSDAEIARELASAKTASEATTALLSMGGQAAAYGDTAGLTKVFGHMINAGLVKRPDGSKLEAPTSTAIVQAPSGSVDFVGQPIEGRAIQATMPDGSKHFVSPRFMDDAYKRQVQAADAASVKTVKPGEKLVVPRTGQVVAEGNDKAYGGGLVQDEDGNWVRVPGLGAGGTGAGSRTNGKAPASPEAAATSAFENIYKNSEVKLQASQIADGQDYSVRAMRQGAETPEQAARIALDAAANPGKIVPDIDAKTGVWSGVYRNPAIQGGKAFNLAPNFTTTQEVAKREGGELLLKDAAGKMLEAQGAIIAPGNAQAQAAIRDQFIKAANDPAERARMLEIASRAGPQEVDALTRKLDLIKAYGPKPAAPKNTQRRTLGVGGLGGSERYTAPADSKAGRIQAQRADARAKAEADAQQKVAAQQELSKQFRADMSSMEPLELARKYDAMRWNMTTEDAAALQQIERNIR